LSAQQRRIRRTRVLSNSREPLLEANQALGLRQPDLDSQTSNLLAHHLTFTETETEKEKEKEKEKESARENEIGLETKIVTENETETETETEIEIETEETEIETEGGKKRQKRQKTQREIKCQTNHPRCYVVLFSTMLFCIC